MANRFSQIVAPSRFSPLSMEELSFAPVAQRQKEDAINADRAEILNQLNNIEVHEKYQDSFTQEKEALKNELDQLATAIQVEGVGGNSYTDQFMNLRNKYNEATSLSGNIGRASKVKSIVDAGRETYINHAIAGGQSAIDAERNWKAQENNYVKDLPKELSKFDGHIPNMDIIYAPKYADESSVASKYLPYFKGIHASLRKDLQFEMNANGEIEVYSDTVKGEHNTEAIQAFQKVLNSELNNPSSALYRNNEYQGKSKEESAYVIHNMMQMLLQDKSAESEDYVTTLNKGAKTKTLKETAQGSPMDTYMAGSAESLNSHNSVDLKHKLNKLKTATTDEVGNPMEEDERARAIAKTKSEIAEKERMENDPEFIAAIEKDIIDNPQWKEWGVTNFDEYRQFNREVQPNKDYSAVPAGYFVPNATSLLSLETTVQKTNPAKYKEVMDYLDSDATLAEKTAYLENEENLEGLFKPTNERPEEQIFIDEFYKQVQFKDFTEAPKKTKKGSYRPNPITLKKQNIDKAAEGIDENYKIQSRNFITPYVSHVIGYGEESKKVREGLSYFAKSLPFDRLATAGLLTVENADGALITPSYFDNDGVNDTTTSRPDEAENMKEFQDFIGKYGENASYEVDEFISGRGGFPVMRGTVRVKDDGKTISKRFELQLNNKTQYGTNRSVEALFDEKSEFMLGLDENGRNQMRAVKSEMDYGATPITAPFEIEAFEKPTTEKSVAQIEDENVMSDHIRRNHKSIMAAENPSFKVQKGNTAYTEHNFINSEPGQDYQVRIDDGTGAYYTVKKDEEGNITPMTFEDKMKQEIFSLATKKGLLGKLEKKTSKEYITLQNHAKINLLYNLTNSTNDLYTEAETDITFSKDSGYKEALQEFYDLQKDISLAETSVSQLSKAMLGKIDAIYKKIAKNTIYSKNLEIIQ